MEPLAGMPSLWQWLCCSRRRFALSSRKERRRQKALAERQSTYMVKTPDDAPLSHGSGHALSGYAPLSHGDGEADCAGVDANGNSLVQKLLEADAARNRKRRRVDEIFRNQSARETGPSGDLFRLRDRVFRSDRSLSEPDTMYGYVPKAIQGMFISTALEGHKVEDYLHSSRENNDVDRFCRLPTVYDDTTSGQDNGNYDKAHLGNGNHGLHHHDNAQHRMAVHGNGDDDDVFLVSQPHVTDKPASTPYFSTAVTNLDDIDVAMETNTDDVGKMADVDDVVRVTNGVHRGALGLRRGKQSDTEWLLKTDQNPHGSKALVTNNDIENIFSCDGEVLY